MPTITLHDGSKRQVGRIGLGLMGLTWRPQQTPDDQAFELFNTALEKGCNFFNGGEFYGQTNKTANIELLNRYFSAFPQAKDQVFLSIKGGANLETLQPEGSTESLLKSVNNIRSLLEPSGKHLDMFEPARLDRTFATEDVILRLKNMAHDGLYDSISLSEAAAEEIRRAAAVAKISAVEIEFSLWSAEILNNGIMETCGELEIPIIAYSPLGRGFLTGQITKPEDLPEGDIRRHLDRFLPENFKNNLKLVEKIKELAEKRGVTPGQFAIAWVLSFSEKSPADSPRYKYKMPAIIPIPGCTSAGRLLENVAAGDIELTEEELNAVDEIMAGFKVAGHRYGAHFAPDLAF